MSAANRDEFREDSPGQLVRMPDGWAFVPDRLSPTLHSSWELVGRLDAATRALATLDGRASLVQNRLLIILPLLTWEAVESARLEGTHTHVAGVLLQEVAGPPADPIEVSNNRYLEQADQVAGQLTVLQ